MKGLALEDDIVVNKLSDGELDMSMTLTGIFFLYYFTIFFD